jgi:hypothetical protein
MLRPDLRLDVRRRLTREEADTLVGEAAVALPPSEIAPGTVIHDADTGEPVLAYLPLEDAGPLRRAMLTVDCRGGVQRTHNYRSKSRTFGYAPRRPVMGREGCSLTALCSDNPEAARVLESYADVLGRALARVLPSIATLGRETLGEVLPDWRLGTEKLWTSGVINDTAQLPYHRDGFNFPVWSAMPVVRRGTRGGHLHLPEYDLVVPCADATVTYFEGFRWVHGVTPITRVRKGSGYRISIVYYALSGMKNCREAAEETALATVRRTDREREMARRLAAGEHGIPRNVDPVGAIKRMHGTLAGSGFDEDKVPPR